MIKFFKSKKNTEETNKADLFITTSFKLSQLKTIVESSIEETKTNSYKLKIKDSSLVLDFNIKEEKEHIHSSRFRFFKEDNIITVFSQTVIINLETYKESVSNAKDIVSKTALFKSIQKQILKLQDDHLYALYNTENLGYIQQPDKFTQNYIFHLLEKQETILSILNASSVTLNTNTLDLDNTSNWYFVITSTRNLIIGVSKENHFTIDISQEKLTLTEKTGKDLILGETFSLLTELMNDSYYVSLFPVAHSVKNKLDIFGDCLVKKYNSKSKYLQLAAKCYTLQLEQNTLDIFALKSELILLMESLKIDKKQHEEIRLLFSNCSLRSATFGEDLIKIVTSWHLDYNTQLEFSTLLFNKQNITSIENSIAYQRYFRPIFLKAENKPEKQFEFNLNFAKVLAKSKCFSDAISIYRNIYKTLPDDSIIDLIPTNTTNIFEGQSGQALKINILESILCCQQKANFNTDETLLKLAQLQPLVSSRIEALKHTKYKNLSTTITQTLHLNNVERLPKDFIEKDYYKLEKTDVLETVTPECFKNASGFFDSLNSYIANIKQPDYSSVISFSDKLNSNNYPNIHKVVTNICYALNLKTPECYIGRANYADSIIGIEGKPHFLIIGNNFIKTNTTKQLNFNELRFLIAVELAHIYFEHSKITSTDVWRGAAEKGFSVISVLLTILPFAGSLGSILGNFTNVDKYLKIVNNVEKASNVAEKGQDILDVGDKLNINFLKKDEKNSSSQDLLITSRLMEIIADKVALIFCDDLYAAIRSIILSSQVFESELPAISKYGLINVLEGINDKGEFYHQETIIRIKSLCSFYLSESFIELKNKLNKS